jgi:hypothetical protein
MNSLWLILGVAMVVTWISTLFMWNMLLSAFRERYPEEAKARFRGAEMWIPTGIGSHVSAYFLSAKSKEFLEGKRDVRMLLQRRLAIFLIAFSAILPFLGFTIIGIIQVVFH